MTDRQRMLDMLREAGSSGVHTFDLRQQGVTGNPSERRRELEARGFVIHSTREKRGDRWGARYRLLDSAAAIARKPSEPMAWFKDFTRPGTDWEQVPVGELGAKQMEMAA